MKKHISLTLLLLVGIVMSGCVKDPNVGSGPGGELNSFDWKATKQIPVNITSDNGTSTPVFIYDGNTLVAAGYTPFVENISVPTSVDNLSVTTFPKDPALSKAYDGKWKWPAGQVVDVTLSNGFVVTVSGLQDLHATIFTNWEQWQRGGHDWASFVANWNAGATQNSSIILYENNQPFIAGDGEMDVVHACLWPECLHGEPVGSPKKGTYLFEDLFPSMGDYDMNDMVVEEYITTTVGKKNQIIHAELIYKVKAAGTGVDIAMAAFLPNTKSSDIKDVTMFRVDAAGNETPYACTNTSGLFKLNSGNGIMNSVEIASAHQTVIPLFENIRALIVPTVPGKYFNTVPTANGGKGEPVTIKVNIEFKPSHDASAEGLTDLFIMPKIGEGANDLEKWRGHEIHLADAQPTDRMDMTLFGTGDSAGEGSSNYKTFRTKDGYVWAIYLPVVDFEHPIENEPGSPNKIYDSYPGFKSWIESTGKSRSEWYSAPVENRVWKWN